MIYIRDKLYALKSNYANTDKKFYSEQEAKKCLRAMQIKSTMQGLEFNGCIVKTGESPWYLYEIYVSNLYIPLSY